MMGLAGASESIVNERVAGVWSVLAAWSVARTSKLWAPCVKRRGGGVGGAGARAGAEGSRVKAALEARAWL